MNSNKASFLRTQIFFLTTLFIFLLACDRQEAPEQVSLGVQGIFPPPRSRYIPPDAGVAVFFNKAINPETVNRQSFIVAQARDFSDPNSCGNPWGENILQGSITVADRMILFLPEEPLRHAELFCAAFTTAIQDFSGNPPVLTELEHLGGLSLGNDTRYAWFFYSVRPGQAEGTWSIPIKLANQNGNATSHASASDLTGRRSAIWIQELAEGNNTLWLNRFDPGRGQPLGSFYDPSGWGEEIQQLGQNVSNPMLSLNPEGKGIVAWEETVAEKIVVSLLDSEGNFSPPFMIDQEQEADDSHLIAAEAALNGDLIVVWQNSDGLWSRHYDTNTENWGDIVKVNEYDEEIAESITSASFSVDLWGNGMAVWTSLLGGARTVWSRRYWGAASQWLDPRTTIRVDAGNSPKIKLVGNGSPAGFVNALVVYKKGGTLVAKKILPDNLHWDENTEPLGRAENFSLATDTIGNFMVLWEEVAPIRSVRVRRYSSDGNWDDPEILGTGRDPSISMDLSGNAIAVWRREGNRPVINQRGWDIVSKRFSSATERWQEEAQLLEIRNAGYVENPKIRFGWDGTATATWTQSDGAKDNPWSTIWYFNTLPITDVDITDVDNDGEADDVDPTIRLTFDFLPNTSYFPESWVLGPNSEHQIGSAGRVPNVGRTIINYPPAKLSYSTNYFIKTRAQKRSPNSGIFHAPPFISSFKVQDATWDNDPFLLSAENETRGEEPRVAISPDGHVTVIWLEGERRNRHLMERRFDNVRWRAASFIGRPNAGDITEATVKLDASNDSHVLFSQGGNLYSKIFQNNMWGNTRQIDSIEANLGRVDEIQLDVNKQGNAVAVWSQPDAGNIKKIWVARYSKDTDSWEEAFRLNTIQGESCHNPHASISDSDKIVVCWIQYSRRLVKYTAMAHTYEAHRRSLAPHGIDGNNGRTGTAINPPKIQVIMLGQWHGQEQAFAVWYNEAESDERGSRIELFGNFLSDYRQNSWQEQPYLIASSERGISAVKAVSDGEGNIIVLWNQLNRNNRGSLITRKFIKESGKWSDSTPAGGTNLIGNAAINLGSSTSGNIITLYEQRRGNQPLMILSNFGIEGLQWMRGDGFQIDNTNVSQPTLAVNPAGRAVAVWKKEINGNYRIFARQYRPLNPPPD